MNNVVTEVVDKGLCSSCGVCIGLCPSGALSLTVKDNGDLAPYADSVHCIEKCHLCLDVCPFSSGFHNPRKRNVKLFSDIPAAKYDEDIGWYKRLIVGFRKNDELRKASASGGLITWCLEALLQKKLVTRVAVVRMAENITNGFFEFYAASSVEELRASSGSVYHPVEISGIVKKIKSDNQERWAIVGVPCLCAAIRNSPALRKKVPFVLGMACGMYQNTFYTEMLLAESGVDRTNIKSIEYRRKSDDGPASDYRFRGTDNRMVGKEIAYHGLPYYLGKNAFFRLDSCNFCMDVFAEAADACFMDAWLPAYRNEPKGTSLAVVRNNVLSKLFQQGRSEGKIQFDEMDSEEVVQSQKGHVRRKRELIYMRRGVQEPEDFDRAKPSLVERITWWLQKRVQQRSKSAWTRYGRKYGRFAFWLALADMLIIQNVVNYVSKLILFPKRLTGKFKRTFSRTL